MTTMTPSIADIARNKATMADIKRLEDADVSPFSGKAWPQGRESLLAKRRKLPVYGSAAKLLEVYHQNQVIILSSNTGSGKSTQVPQMLVYDEYSSGLMIACTQPRKLAAKELAKRVATEMGVAVGETVGFQVGGQAAITKTGDNTTRLSFMTEQTLVNQIMKDRKLSKYACVIVDEAHERTKEVDTLMPLLKEAVARRKDFKVIIMSATINSERFKQYFNNCPVFHVPGRTYEVQIRHLEPSDALDDYMLLAASLVQYIHINKGPGNILVFATGYADISKIADLVRRSVPGLVVSTLMSSLSSEAQARALDQSGPNRKCIISTNVAETSLTLDGVVFVIDCGLSQQAIYNPRLRVNTLTKRLISRASAMQRAGRAGRTANGVCYRLYTEKTFNEMEESTAPSIMTSSVADVCLNFLANGIPTVLDFDWLDAPHLDTFASAFQDLHTWGLVNDACIITDSGMKASTFQLSPPWFRAIEEASVTGAGSIDMVDIAVLCSSQKSIFLRPAGDEMAADRARAMFEYGGSDHITLLNAFRQFEKAYDKSESDVNFSLSDWCKKHYLDLDVLAEALDARVNVSRRVASTKLRASTSLMSSPGLIKAIARAFSNQIAYFDGNNYRTVNTHVMARVPPHSSLLRRSAAWVVYTKLSMPGQSVEMDAVSMISLDWLLDLPMFQLDTLSKKQNGAPRQPLVYQSIQAAKAAKAGEATPAATEE